MGEAGEEVQGGRDKGVVVEEDHVRGSGLQVGRKGGYHGEVPLGKW